MNGCAHSWTEAKRGEAFVSRTISCTAPGRRPPCGLSRTVGSRHDGTRSIATSARRWSGSGVAPPVGAWMRRSRQSSRRRRRTAGEPEQGVVRPAVGHHHAGRGEHEEHGETPQPEHVVPVPVARPAAQAAPEPRHATHRPPRPVPGHPEDGAGEPEEEEEEGGGADDALAHLAPVPGEQEPAVKLLHLLERRTYGRGAGPLRLTGVCVEADAPGTSERDPGGAPLPVQGDGGRGRSGP